MKTFVRTAVLFVALLLQTSVISQFHMFHAVPNLFLVVLFYTVSVSDMKYTIAVSALFGAALDLLVGKVFGINTALSLLFAIAVSYISNHIRDKKLPYYSVLSFLFTGAYEYCASLFLISGSMSVTLRWAFLHKVIPTALANTVLMIPVYLLLHRCFKKYYEERKREK